VGAQEEGGEREVKEAKEGEEVEEGKIVGMSITLPLSP
jgi:hypothetical protein